MTQVKKAVSCAICTFLLSALSQAVTPGEDSAANPFQPIVARNIFGLKDPPPPAAPVDTRPPPPHITLTGITTILGSKRAFMSVQMPPKPPEPAKVQSFMLSEGQRDGEIEVLAIDDKAGTVKVNDFGTVTNLSFKDNGAKIASSAPAPGAGAGIGGIPAPPPNPFASGGFQGQKTIPTRPLRLPGAAGSSPSASTYGSGSNPSSAAFGAASPLQPGQQGQAQQPQLSAEDHALMLEVERERTKQEVQNGTLPPLPTTRYTPPGAVGSIPDGSSTPNPQQPNGRPVPIPRPGMPILPQ